MDSMNTFMDILEILAGAYMVYCAVKMKTTGEIKNDLVSRSIDPDRAPDKEGYIKAMFLPDIIMGVILILCGCATTGLPAAGVSLPEIANELIIGFALAIFIIYGVMSMKAQKKYLVP